MVCFNHLRILPLHSVNHIDWTSKFFCWRETSYLKSSWGEISVATLREYFGVTETISSARVGKRLVCNLTGQTTFLLSQPPPKCLRQHSWRNNRHLGIVQNYSHRPVCTHCHASFFLAIGLKAQTYPVHVCSLCPGWLATCFPSKRICQTWGNGWCSTLIVHLFWEAISCFLSGSSNNWRFIQIRRESDYHWSEGKGIDFICLLMQV